MSMRWIHETQTPPNCVEESSDIDDSCSDDSYDSDLSFSSDYKDDDQNRKNKYIKQYPPCFTIGDQRKNRKYVEDNNRFTQCIIWDPRPPALNPVYHNSKIKLHCRVGYQLSVDECGNVRGVLRQSKYPDVFVICPAEQFGIVRIRNTQTGFCIAFSAKGRLYGERNAEKDNTEWEQWSIGSFDAFRSRKYAELNWWIGIKKNGRPKLGPTTIWGQKAIQFSPVIQEIKKA